MGFQTVLLFLLLAVQQVVKAQYDPVSNYCRRLDHQSTIINGMLYIDGGREVFATTFENGTQMSNRTLGNNQYLIAVNMSQSWDWQNGLPQTEFSKNKDVTGTLAVPDMSRGALYPDPVSETTFWLFGGSTATDNQTFPGWQYPQPQADSLWSYDTVKNSWTAYNMSAYDVHKPASGATVSVPDTGLAFYFNGEQDNGTSSETTDLVAGIQFLSGMLVLDLNNQTAKNISTKAVSDNARVRGQMVHVPLNGTDGILVLIGGGEKPVSDSTHNWRGNLVSLESVDIFDVGSLKNASTPDGTWYSQNTTAYKGSFPAPRLDACMVVVSAPDNSSHNIYLYGGRDGLNTYYDEVWILSIPSFQWVLVWSGSSPRYSPTCHVVGHRQMITVGGSDTPKLTSACDWEAKGVAILDLSTIAWGSAYTADDEDYVVPDAVVAVIGGSSSGGAKTIAPAGGFASTELAALFGQVNTTTTATATPPPATSSAAATTKKHTSAGAIAGGVIGGLAVLAAILGAILFFLNRVKRNRRPPVPEAAQLQGPEKDMHPAALDSAPVYEKSGQGISELSSSHSKSDLSNHKDAVAPVEMPADELRWSLDKKRGNGEGQR